MASLAKWFRFGRQSPLAPRVFSGSFRRLDATRKIEEETLPRYQPAHFYPVRIGEVFASRYQVVGKLGFGVSSTVWLARDLHKHNHVALKIFIRMEELGRLSLSEVNIYKKISAVSASSSHPGRLAIRSVLDNFKITGQMESIITSYTRRYFLHTECHLVHTDIKADNIVYSLSDKDPVLEQLEEDEIKSPTPRKEAEDGRVVYLSRMMTMPKSLGYPVLCDFGSAMPGDQINTADVQPNAYRSPELMMEIPWDYKIDIWNVGCMVWDMCEGKGHLFNYMHPELRKYRSAVHMASVISLLGPPPPEMIERCTVRKKFFNDKGEFDCEIPVPPSRTWAGIETAMEQGEDREMFFQLMRKMIEWVPEKRATAAELANDEWVQKHRADDEEL